MTDRPIIFSAPMVRALLAGTKTQTRRIAKGRRDINIGCEIAPSEYAAEARAGNFENLPYAPGDRLWVRENWQALSFGDYTPTMHHVSDVRYAATEPAMSKDARGYSWRPSIHMPRWASRLTLTVTDIRVERLQDISEDDARAEGVSYVDGNNCDGVFLVPGSKSAMSGTNARDCFSRLWNEINGPDAWKANPWVIAVSFTVHKSNIDAMEREKAA